MSSSECVTMWMLTPEFCKTIPAKKSNRVVFTLTAYTIARAVDEKIINTLVDNYDEVYFWPQGLRDYQYLKSFKNTEKIQVLTASKDAYDEFLTKNDTDYVGTRLHGGIYAMRHGRRSIIVAIDERAREINKVNHLNCIDMNDIKALPEFINSEFETCVKMDFDAINRWKSQFEH